MRYIAACARNNATSQCTLHPRNTARGVAALLRPDAATPSLRQATEISFARDGEGFAHVLNQHTEILLLSL